MWVRWWMVDDAEWRPAISCCFDLYFAAFHIWVGLLRVPVFVLSLVTLWPSLQQLTAPLSREDDNRIQVTERCFVRLSCSPTIEPLVGRL
jgi:hypothetical protein